MPGVATPLSEGLASWTKDVGSLLERMGGEFTDLKEKTQRDLIAAGREIAALKDDFAEVKGRYAERFHALAREARNGTLRHGFHDDETARRFGALIQAGQRNDHAAISELQRAGLIGTTGQYGGWLLVDTIVADIMRELDDAGIFLGDCKPALVGSLKGGSPRGTSGFAVYHPDYGVAGTVSTPGIGSTAWELVRYVAAGEIEQWMLASEMAIALAEYVRREIVYCLQYATDLEWFMGDGTSAYGKYTGLFKLTGSATVSATQPTVITADSGDDTFLKVTAKTSYYLAQMLGALPTWAHHAGPRFYLHPVAFFSYFGVRDSGGMPVANIVFGAGPQLTLFGLPVRLVPVAPSVTAVSTVFVILAALDRSCRTYRHRSAVEFGWSDNLGEDKWLAGISGVKCDVPMDMRVRVPSGIVQLATHS
jgi:HK97 family phage major capsid protein